MSLLLIDKTHQVIIAVTEFAATGCHLHACTCVGSIFTMLISFFVVVVSLVFFFLFFFFCTMPLRELLFVTYLGRGLVDRASVV